SRTVPGRGYITRTNFPTQQSFPRRALAPQPVSISNLVRITSSGLAFFRRDLPRTGRIWSCG
ncbi:MAG: hypothetical protein ACRD4F_01565, partial [Candidatus Angelobacter sp.]